MREHSFTESYDRSGAEEGTRRRAAPGRTAATAQLAPRPQVMRAASGPAPEGATETKAAAPTTFEDPFALHLSETLARAASGPTSGLPDALREQFGTSLGKDLSDVRLHTDATAATAAQAFSAKALTVGNDIYFAAGAYDPASSHGQHLLAHEVAHTAQQGAAPASGASSPQALTVSSPGDACETEADHAAEAMLAGAPVTTSAHAAIGRVVMRSPNESNDGNDGSGGGGGAGGAPPMPSFDDGRGGEHGSSGAPDPQQRERRRAELASHGRDWRAAAGPGTPMPLDEGAQVPDAGRRPCPSPAVDISEAPEWFDAFRASWDEVDGIHQNMAGRVADFVNATDRARALGLSRNLDSSATAGWNTPVSRGNAEKYGEQQGVDGGPSVGEMFKDGKLDESYKGLNRSSSGFADADEKAIRDAISERQKALDAVGTANLEFEKTTETTARSKLLEIKGKDIAIDRIKLNVDSAKKDQQMQDLTRERDRLNAKISVAMSLVDGLLAFTKLKNLEAGNLAAAGEPIKATAGTATNLVNFEYNGRINEISAAMGAIKVSLAEKDLELALLDKERAAIEYQGWLKTELMAKGAAVREKFTAYKTAQETAAKAFATAAKNKTKAEQEKRGGKRDAVADEAEQKAAGDKAEAVMRALSVIDTVIGLATAGANSCREPGYTRESGIGFAMAGSPGELPTRLGVIRSYRAGFQQVAAKWQARRTQVGDIIDSHSA